MPMTRFDVALAPACQALAKLHGRTITGADGSALTLALKPEACRVDESANRVTLGFTLGADGYSVSMRRHAFWSVPLVADWIEAAMRNENLTPDETFDLDIYDESRPVTAI